MSDTDPNEKQVGGSHYKHAKFQPWDWAQNNKGGLGYYEVSAIKYIVRFRSKNGVEDLRKAQHYVEKLISVAKAGQYCYTGDRPKIRLVCEFNRQNGCDRFQGDAVLMLTQWRDMADLEEAIKVIEELIQCELDNEADEQEIIDSVAPRFTTLTQDDRKEAEQLLDDVAPRALTQDPEMPLAAIPPPPFKQLKPALKVPKGWEKDNNGHIPEPV